MHLEPSARPGLRLGAPLLAAAAASREASAPRDQDLDAGRTLRATGHIACCGVLLLSCLGASVLILTEAVQGIRDSVYCRRSEPRQIAPKACVVPLAAAAVACHVAVVLGLLCIAKFAWQARNHGEASIIDIEQHRSALRADLRRWRSFSAMILFAAGAVYILAGAPCAGLARPAFVFLAMGFLTLYATALFFDDDFEQVRMSPRLIRFLLTYTLVGLTFSTMSSGVLEWRHPRGMHNGTGASGEGFDSGVDEEVPSGTFCTASGREMLSPPSCTVPLDLASVVSLWWAASPLFAVLLPARRNMSARCEVRRVLQTHRRHVDVLIVCCTLGLMVGLRDPCLKSSPRAFGNAQLGAFTVVFLMLLRRSCSAQCDGWRGPLEHLPTIHGPDFSMTQCTVCLSDLCIGEDVCRTPCGHDFHRDCLEEWVLSKRDRVPDCPLCRETLFPPEPDSDLLGLLR